MKDSIPIRPIEISKETVCLRTSRAKFILFMFILAESLKRYFFQHLNRLHVIKATCDNYIDMLFEEANRQMKKTISKRTTK
jgi:hypothetical protein